MARTTRATTVSKESWRNYANRRQPYIRSVLLEKVIQERAVSSVKPSPARKASRGPGEVRGQLPAAGPIFRNPPMKFEGFLQKNCNTTSAITTPWGYTPTNRKQDGYLAQDNTIRVKSAQNSSERDCFDVPRRGYYGQAGRRHRNSPM